MTSQTSAPELTGQGTPEATWSRCSTLAALPPWSPRLPASGRIVVVAPHPDDEILGAGGITARLCRLGAQVDLVAVTDGEHSHPGLVRYLRIVRPLETLAAACQLGIDFGSISRLRHPDGQVDKTKLTGQLAARIRPGDLVLAPWARDGHPDHDAVGRAVETMCARIGEVVGGVGVAAVKLLGNDLLHPSEAQGLRGGDGPDRVARHQAREDALRALSLFG